jgi:hypothetical protein
MLLSFEAIPTEIACQKLMSSHDRSAHINRDYCHPFREKNDDWLKRSYRLEISPMTKNPGGPLSPEVLLATNLRFLAGRQLY